MPVTQDAIDRFLARVPPPVPTFKGVNEDVLWKHIYYYLGGMYPRFRTKLRKHQLEALAFALFKQRSLCLYEMRLGKSAIALSWAMSLRQAGLWTDKGLVIAHSPIGLDVWQSEARKHSDLKVVSIGTKPHAFVDALESDADLLIAPWSSLQHIFGIKRQNKKGKNELVPDHQSTLIAAEMFSLAVIDEIHLVKDPDTLRFKIASGLLSNCQYRLGLTGTPIGRDPYAIWSQAFLIDNGALFGTSYHFFKMCFGDSVKNWFTKTDQYKFADRNLPKMETWLQSMALSYKLSEVQTTDVIANVIELQMSKEQGRVYSEVIDKLIRLRADEDTEIQNTFHRLRQISSGYMPFVDNEGNERLVHFPNTPKLLWLGELVEAMPDDVQAVIFCEYRHTGQLICEVLQKAKRSFGWLYGDTGAKKRTQMVDDFQRKKIQFLVCNTISGGTGIDLKNADYLLFFESTPSPIYRSQAQARPLGRGERPLVMDDLVCSGVERKILSFIEQGRNLAATLTRDRNELKEESRTLRKRAAIKV